MSHALTVAAGLVDIESPVPGEPVEIEDDDADDFAVDDSATTGSRPIGTPKQEGGEPASES